LKCVVAPRLRHQSYRWFLPDLAQKSDLRFLCRFSSSTEVFCFHQSYYIEQRKLRENDGFAI